MPAGQIILVRAGFFGLCEQIKNAVPCHIGDDRGLFLSILYWRRFAIILISTGYWPDAIFYS